MKTLGKNGEAKIVVKIRSFVFSALKMFFVLGGILLVANADGNDVMAIARTNADLIHLAAKNTVSRIWNFQQCVDNFMAVPSEKNYALAKASLRAARASFFCAEIGFLYRYPASLAEQRALPDPINLYRSNGELTTFEELDNLLDGYHLRHDGPNSSMIVESIARQTQELATRFDAFAWSWEVDNKDGFRNKFFLRNPDDAIARMFQGMIAFTDIVLPRQIEGGGSSGENALSAVEVRTALLGIQNLYLGYVRDSQETPTEGLRSFVATRNLKISHAIEKAIDQVVSAACQLEIKDDVIIRKTLFHFLADLSKNLKNAESLLDGNNMAMTKAR